MFSSRVPAGFEPNRLTRALARAKAERRDVLDLTVSNPTQVGVAYPDDLLAPLGSAAGLTYAPDPRGGSSARAAVAEEYARHGAMLDPARIVLTAITSEAYAWLFKLLCSPGDAVLVPQPSYPLFDHLARLEGVQTAPYCLDLCDAWHIDRRSVRQAWLPTVRAVLAVSPNNPTGSRLAHDDWQWLDAWCGARGAALIVDEVFADYALDSAPDGVASVTAAPRGWSQAALTFALGGVSKSCGLPQVKVGWIVVGGPAALAEAALPALDLIADTYLSVGTPAQQALPTLLARGADVRDRIRARVHENLTTLASAVSRHASCTLHRPEGGWTAVVRVPAVLPEEDFVVLLLDRHSVLVHPGYFFDFPAEAFVVVSLLPLPRTFAEGMDRMLGHVGHLLERPGAAMTLP